MRIIALWVLAVCMVAAVLLRGRYVEAHLLRADPGGIPSDTTLMSFATGRGRLLFEAHCASCHGPAAHGDRAKGIPDLTDDDWLCSCSEARNWTWRRPIPIAYPVNAPPTAKPEVSVAGN